MAPPIQVRVQLSMHVLVSALVRVLVLVLVFVRGKQYTVPARCTENLHLFNVRILFRSRTIICCHYALSVIPFESQ